MNLLQHYLSLFIVLSTIPIEAKISIQSAQDSLSKIFTRAKEENIVHKEYTGIKNLELLCEQGNISIHTWKQSSTMIELKKIGSKIAIDRTAIEFSQYEEILQIHAICNDKKNIATIHINIIVPEQTFVKVATKKGNIIIKNLSETINAQTNWGNIDIVDGFGDIFIHSKHGNINIQRESMMNTENINATTDNGTIFLQVPQHINCNIKAEALGNKIYSDLLITVQPKVTKLTDEVYKKQQHQLLGAITNNEGSSPSGLIALATKHGSIKIKSFI